MTARKTLTIQFNISQQVRARDERNNFRAGLDQERVERVGGLLKLRPRGPLRQLLSAARTVGRTGLCGR
jgi:hypothetical protein